MLAWSGEEEEVVGVVVVAAEGVGADADVVEGARYGVCGFGLCDLDQATVALYFKCVFASNKF